MPPQQQQNSDENASLWISALTIVALIILWVTMHEWISFFFLKLKLLELDLIKPFDHQYDALGDQLRSLTLTQAKGLKVGDLFTVGNTVGDALRYPVIVIIMTGAAILYFGSTTAKFRNKYSIEQLAGAEKVNWPQISPIIPTDLINVPLDEGPWAMALNPMHFAKKYHLLTVEKQLAEEDQLSSAVKLKVTLKRLESKQIFLMQLGNYWHSPQALPPHTRALFAMFAAKAHSDQAAVQKLNNQIAVSAANTAYKQIDYRGVDELIAKHINQKNIQQVIQNHAFVYTVMASMLELSRTDGVYASSDFLWLKPIDRRLWYTLNSVGRKTPFSEVAGIFAHRNAELMYHKPLYVPMVDEAVDALEIAISEILFKPDEDPHA